MNNQSIMNETPVTPGAEDQRPVFDSGRAAQLRSSVVRYFEDRLRKVERYLSVCTTFALLCALWAATRFFQSATADQWIIYAVLFLVMFQTTVLLKLWYWTTNSKLGVLHEIRLLRLEARLARSPAESLEAIGDLEPGAKPGGLSHVERRFWNGLVVGLALCIGLTPLWPALKLAIAGSEMISRRSVVLEEDGTARMETTYELPNTSVVSIRERAILEGGSVSAVEFVPAERSSWGDGRGRKLAVRREPAGGNVRQVIQLIDPVRSGQPYVLHHVGTKHATQEGDVWTFTVRQNWGYTSDRYFESVALPPGAELVSAVPEPVTKEKRDGRTILAFCATRHQGLPWEYSVKYRR